MSSWYYTDYWRKQHGPVGGADLLELNRSGALSAESLVWREGAEQWRKLKDAATELYGKKEDGTYPELAVCAYSGRVLPLSELLPYGKTFVAVDCKEFFLQNLMESGYRPIDQRDEEAGGAHFVGFWMRAVGSLLDEVIKGAAWTLLIVAGVAVTSYFSSFDVMMNQGGAGGAVFMLVIAVAGLLCNAGYEIGMTASSFQGTLGKMAIGAKVTNPDGTRITYGCSFLRWLAKCPVFLELTKILPILMFYLFAGMIFLGTRGQQNAGVMVASWIFAFVFPVAFSLAVTSVFWMAAFDPEKRALHDRVASTRVILR